VDEALSRTHAFGPERLRVRHGETASSYASGPGARRARSPRVNELLGGDGVNSNRLAVAAAGRIWLLDNDPMWELTSVTALSPTSAALEIRYDDMVEGVAKTRSLTVSWSPDDDRIAVDGERDVPSASTPSLRELAKVSGLHELGEGSFAARVILLDNEAGTKKATLSLWVEGEGRFFDLPLDGIAAIATVREASPNQLVITGTLEGHDAQGIAFQSSVTFARGGRVGETIRVRVRQEPAGAP
jgi:hypothetical protein